MSTPERRKEFFAAIASPDGVDSLLEAVQSHVDRGVPNEALLDDLEQIKDLVPHDLSDSVIDVMDLLYGYPYPERKLKPRTPPPTPA